MTSRAVTRGESLPDGLAVCIDWLAFTYTPADDAWKQALEAFLQEEFGATGEWVESDRGWQGYERTARVDGALISWGGAGQRGTVHVEIPGVECNGCSSWDVVVDWLASVGARLTRVDIAGDDFMGQEVTVSKAVEWFRAGLFAGAGRPPSGRVIDDLGCNTGKTLYVGSRAAGKIARVYEKGRQLGDPSSPWVRFEVEWRARCRVLSLEMLLRPAEFLSGSFDCARLWSVARQSIRTLKTKAKISFDVAVANARAQCGKVVSMILEVSGGDMWAVVSLLRRSGMPARVDRRDILALSG